MKKFIVLSLFVLLLTGSSSVAYAQKLDFRASGWMDAMSIFFKNDAQSNVSGQIFDTLQASYKPPATTTPTASSQFNQKAAYMISRMRLKFDAVMDKALSGTIFLEADSTTWGDTPGGNLNKVSERNTMGFWSADRAAVEIKNVYIDFGLPYFGIPVPISARVGLHPLSIRPNLFVYTDGMGITGKIDLSPVTIEPLWFKPLEGRLASSDDVDVYGLHTYAKIGVFTVGGYGLYYKMNTYPLNTATFTYGTINPSVKADMWWYGVYADGKAGPVNLNFDFIYDRGEVKKVSGGTVAQNEVKYRGWITRLKLDYPWV